MGKEMTARNEEYLRGLYREASEREREGRAGGVRRRTEFQKMYPRAGGLAAVVLCSLICSKPGCQPVKDTIPLTFV